MRLALLAILLVSVGARAADPLPPALDVRRARVVLQDGTEREVVEGCWLRTDVCISSGSELVQLRAENASLRESAGSGVSPVVVAVVAVLALGAGFAAAEFLSPPPAH